MKLLLELARKEREFAEYLRSLGLNKAAKIHDRRAEDYEWNAGK